MAGGERQAPVGYDGGVVPEDGKDAATVPGRGLAVSPSSPTGGTLATTGASGDMTLASAETAAAPPIEPDAGLASGTKVGRFLVLARVGAGGMGEVYSAYDPELDRRVALKLLRRDVAGSGEVAEARLRREARTMARIVDRNLVTVHDVGVHDRQVFIAMEFVDGATLRTWCEDKSWELILAAYLEAGRGLVAAHAAGIVHRDFKPDNVLVSRDGRVAVTDFGIARTPGSIDSEERAEIEDIRLTTTGAIIGTPRYMAPEQLDGTGADVRSDQFSFCVSLWEGLYGEHPYVGDGASFPALRAAVLKGELRPIPPGKGKVPPRLRAALARGLAVDPARRWPSFGALLAALDVLAPSRRWVFAVLAGAGVIAAGSVAYGAWQANHRVVDAGEICTGSEAFLRGVWDEPRKADMKAAFLATGQPYAEVAYNLVRVRLDDWSHRWVDARTHACRATHVYREQTEATLEGEMRCFDAQRMSTRALVDVFVRADSDQVENAAWALGKLPRPERCNDLGQIANASQPPSDPRRARLVDGLEERVATARALLDTGDYQGALLVLGPALVTAQLVSYPPVEAQIQVTMGQAQLDLGAMDLARVHLDRAMQLADEGKDDLLRSDAAQYLAQLAYYRENYDEALRFLAIAEGTLRRIGADDLDRASVLQTHGIIDLELGKIDAAVAELQESVHIYEKRKVQDVEVAEAYAELAAAEEAAHQPNLAAIDYQHAIAFAEQVVGGKHPFVAKALVNYGAFLLKNDQLEPALPLFQRALAIKEAALGPEHPSLAYPLQNIAVIERLQGKLADAERDYQRALAMFESTPESAYAVPSSLAGLALVRLALDRPGEAVPLLERAIKLRGVDKRTVADGDNQFHLAVALWKSGADRGVAKQHALIAREIFKDAGDSARLRLNEVDRWLADPAHYVASALSPI
jgi:tetratricopeptide (TPR) repeat protein